MQSDEKINFLPVLASTLYNKLKEVVTEVVWQDLGNCRSIWFPPSYEKHLHMGKFHVKVCPTELDDECVFIYDDYICRSVFDEKAVISTMYTNEAIYDKLGREMSIVIAVAVTLS